MSFAMLLPKGLDVGFNGLFIHAQPGNVGSPIRSGFRFCLGGQKIGQGQMVFSQGFRQRLFRFFKFFGSIDRLVLRYQDAGQCDTNSIGSPMPRA